MKTTNTSSMYVACAYMPNTKSDDLSTVLRYKNSRAYLTPFRAILDGESIIIEAYNKIMNGDIAFTGIEHFDKNNVLLKYCDCSTAVLYKYPDNDYTEILCTYNIEEICCDDRVIIYYSDKLYSDIRHMFYRYGMFWYLIGNVNECPCIVKKFWWFTKLDSMLYYLFNKFEDLAI